MATEATTTDCTNWTCRGDDEFRVYLKEKLNKLIHGSKSAPPSDGTYDKMGCSLIFNNKLFIQKQAIRSGSEIDEKNLSEQLENLGFDVIVFNDLSSVQMMEAAKEGVPPTDQRGKHHSRPKAFTDEKQQLIIDHIRSFKGRQSHYTLKESRVLYLPEELKLQKMHRLFLEQHPNETCSRESYRNLFMQKFNIRFGYPRKDTCSTCDRYKTEMSKSLEPDQLRLVQQEKELHLRKAQTFYDRKTSAARYAKNNPSVAAVCFDFWKNLPSPNITTNDVYYKRQLSAYTFNVHNLGTDEVHLYSYDETVGKKGSNDVTSMLMHFFENLSDSINELTLFCDSCGGQNKNWTVLRMLHYVVNHTHRFNRVKLMFPIRGHSYMECDRDMVPINQKLTAETPDEWRQHFAVARQNPSPFNVVTVDNTMLLSVEKHVQGLYYSMCPVKTQPLREVHFTNTHPRLMMHRESWNGPFLSAVVSKPAGKRRLIQPPLSPLATQPLPISAPKHKDLQDLLQFCIRQESRDFFSSLMYEGQDGHESDVSLIDDEEEEEC